MLVTDRRSVIGALLASPLFGVPAFAQAKPRYHVIMVENHPVLVPSENIFFWALPKRFGWFEQEGVDFTPKAVVGATPALQAVTAGSAQLGTMAPEVIMAAREGGGDVFSVFVHKTRSGWMLGVPPESKIQSLAEFKGKKIGVAGLGSAAVNVLHVSLAEAGLQKSDYSIVATGQGAAGVIALKTGNVDALGLWDAAFGELQNIGNTFRFIPLPVTQKLAGLPIGTSRKLYDERRQELTGLFRCFAKGIVFCKTNVDAAIRIFLEEFPEARPANVPADQFLRNARNTMVPFLANCWHLEDKPVGWHNPEQWAQTHQFFIDSGVLKGTKNPAETYTNDLIAEVNKFDMAEIRALAAKS